MGLISCIYVRGSTLTSSRSVDQLSQQQDVTKSGVVSPPWTSPKTSRRCPLDAVLTAVTVASVVAPTSTSPDAAVCAAPEVVSVAATRDKYRRLVDGSRRH